MVAVAIPLDRSIGGGDRDVPGCRYGSHLVRIATQWLSPGFDGLLCFLLHGAAVEDEGVFAVVDRENLATDAAVGGSQGWGWALNVRAFTVTVAGKSSSWMVTRL